MLIYFLTLLALLCSALSYAYIRYAHHYRWLDVPNARSSHHQSTPRGGGLVFIFLWLIASIIALLWQVWSLPLAVTLLPGTLLVAVIGYADDHYDIRPRWRALAYLLAAIVSVLALGGVPQFILSTHWVLPLGGFGAVLAVLAIVWSTNLFNFMDGLDGIAALEALFVLTSGGFFIWCANGHGLATIIWMLAACVAGFLVWNKPRAKLFMGDVGSATLGFVIMVLAFMGEKYYHVPVLLWVITYGVFIADATLTLLRRFLAKEPVYQAHRLHAYQRLHQAGFSHARVVLMVMGVNTVLLLLALAGFYYQDYLPLFLVVAGVMLLGLYGIVERVRPMYPVA